MSAVALALVFGLLSAPAERPAAYAFEQRGLDGKTVSLKALQGKVVVVSFWATWCVPCKKALPVLDKLRAKHPDGLEVVAVSIDDNSTRSRVRSTAKRYKWKMPVVVDENGDIGKAMNPRGLAPYTVFVDHLGRQAHAQEGFSSGDAEKFAARIEALLAERRADTAEKPAK